MKSRPLIEAETYRDVYREWLDRLGISDGDIARANVEAQERIREALA